MTSDTPLCHINDIAKGESKGFRYQSLDIIAVRKNDQLYLYHNRCPHLGVPLQWQADRFLNVDKTLIQCSTHGALFTIEDGHCISGPCKDQALEPLAYTLKEQRVFITGKL